MLRRKILVMTTTFPRWKNDTTPGFVYELSKRLANKNYKIIVLAPHFKGAKKHEILENMEVYRFRYLWPSSLETLCYEGGILPNIRKRPLLSLIQIPAVVTSQFFAALNLINKRKIEFIHAHWIVPQGFTAFLLKRLLKIRYLITVHGSDVSSLRKAIFKPIGKMILKSADCCTVNSNFTKRILYSIHKHKKIEIIPMGIDVSKFLIKKYTNTNKNNIKKPTILFVGRLSKQKGLTYLISAIKLLKNKYPRVTLSIIGEGAEKIVLEEKIRKLNLKNNVNFVGAVKNSNLPDYYSKADVFVLPSINTEGLGMVLLESISCGTPVIGSKVGGIPEIISHGKTGLLVNQKNPKELENAIERMIFDKKLRSKTISNGRKMISDKYDWSTTTKKFNKLISELV